MKTALMLAIVAATCALAACSGSKEPEANHSTEPALTEKTIPPTIAAVPVPAAVTPLPVAMRGHWGLVPADCTSTRGDAKGLVTITADSLQFYESIAILESTRASSETELRGTFAYSGEGMEWSRETTLAVKDGGKALVFEEFGNDAPKGARTYTRCPQ
ncbi:MAG: hypothetical protein ACKOPG_03750 [Novosphingobium sp.]